MVEPRRIIEGSQLTGSAATYYTAPAATRARIRKLTFCNTTVGAVAVTVYLIPSGGSAGAANTLWSAKSLAPGETKECYEAQGHVLETGDFIQALGLNVTIQGTADLIT